MPTAIYVKKTITGEEWETWYKHHTKYLKLKNIEGGRSGGRTVIAFVGYDNLAEGCQYLNDFELVDYQDYCKDNHIYPRPMETEEDRRFNQLT